jgi:hypothetical protein
MEAWISNTEMSKYIGVHPNTLYRMRLKGYFSKGIHWRYKDPLNKDSHKVWRRSAVDQLLSQPDHILKRKVRKNTREISG